MEKFENDAWKMWIEDDIVFVTYLKEHYNEKMIDEGIKGRLNITKGNEYLIFADIRKLKSTTREGRQRMSCKDGGIGVIAVAILSKSKVQEVIYNFFNLVYKAPAPAKMFTDQNKAIEWLKKIKKNNL